MILPYRNRTLYCLNVSSLRSHCSQTASRFASAALFCAHQKNPRYCPNIAKMQDGPKEGMKDAKRDIFRHRESNPGLAGAPFFRNGLLSDESGKS
jgi:hypothetical protein